MSLSPQERPNAMNLTIKITMQQRTKKCFILAAAFVALTLSKVSGFSFQGKDRNAYHQAKKTTLVADLVPSNKSVEGEPNILVPTVSSALASSPKVGPSSILTSARSCKIKRIQKYARLPVWPAWNGVFLFLVGKVFGEETASKLEQTITGRVCPNFYEYEETTPFIMMVHHCHTFAAFDPLRFFQKTFFPEGFPAHPHRGFVTLTYILQGGFIHRDSQGIRQEYGQVDSAIARYKNKHSQWLNTGAGILHEEMFDLQQEKPFWQRPVFQRQELYQLWINLPASQKLNAPISTVLGGDNETPVVQTLADNGTVSTRTLILAGSYDGASATTPIVTPMSIFHVVMQPDATWTFTLPPTYETLILYVRKGCVLDSDEASLPAHHTVYFDAQGAKLNEQLVLRTAEECADFLVLAGEPIREPCAAQGSMVMNEASEIQQAYADYQRGLFGAPWKETLDDAAWQQHVKQFPCRY